MSREMSLRRKIKRGHAIMSLDSYGRAYTTETKGTRKELFYHAKKNRSRDHEIDYCDNVTMPLTEVDIVQAEDRKKHIYKLKK